MDLKIVEMIWICQIRQNLPNPMHCQQENEEHVDGKVKFWFSLQVTGSDFLGIGGNFK